MGTGLRWWLNNSSWTSNDGTVCQWISVVIRACHLDVAMTMQLTCPWRSWDQLTQQAGNVLKRRILGGAVIQWLAMRAVHDGADVALRRHPLWSSSRSTIRRLRVRITCSAVDGLQAYKCYMPMQQQCTSLQYTPCIYTNTSIICRV